MRSLLRFSTHNRINRLDRLATELKTGIMLLANFVLVYVPGLTQLYLWLSLAKGEGLGLYQVLSMGLFPFIIGDIAKVIAATATARAILPKRF